MRKFLIFELTVIICLWVKAQTLLQHSLARPRDLPGRSCTVPPNYSYFTGLTDSKAIFFKKRIIQNVSFTVRIWTINTERSISAAATCSACPWHLENKRFFVHICARNFCTSNRTRKVILVNIPTTTSTTSTIWEEIKILAIQNSWSCDAFGIPCRYQSIFKIARKDSLLMLRRATRRVRGAGVGVIESNV